MAFLKYEKQHSAEEIAAVEKMIVKAQTLKMLELEAGLKEALVGMKAENARFGQLVTAVWKKGPATITLTNFTEEGECEMTERLEGHEGAVVSIAQADLAAEMLHEFEWELVA